MKEQILYLDPHDDYHSTQDKIGWVQTDRVLLVVPPRRGTKRLFGRQLDLLLIQRHAAKLGAKLALVTDDPLICDHADALGIQVFDAVDDSHLQPWRSRRPAPPARRPKPVPDPDLNTPLFSLPRPTFLQSRRLRLTAGAFTFFCVVVIIGMMLALTLPGAHIALTPHGQTISANLSIIADPSQPQIDAQARVIPAQAVSVVVSGSTEVATTGIVDEATQRAGGVVTFTNLTNQAVRIPAGTAVRTTGGTPIRFVTQQDVTLDAKKGSTGSAPILASEPGPLGNVGAGLINSIEGPMAVQGGVINEEPTSGGEVKQVASVTEDDRKRAKDALLAQLKQQGYAELLAKLKEGEFAPIASTTILRTLDETYDHFAGEKAERLTLEMRIEVGATAVNEQDASVVGQVELDSRLGNLLVIVPATAAFARDQISTVDESGRIRFNITAQADAVAIVNPDDVRAAAQWQLAEETSDKLYAQFPVVTKPEVAVWPKWFPRMPWLPWRIEVTVQPESGGASPAGN
ncbi:MAG TPA: hypothetical protein VJL59_17660 [Anaerolineales bacterium]|nr:hypothetical protein [Anaerolineales bacterium]